MRNVGLSSPTFIAKANEKAAQNMRKPHENRPKIKTGRTNGVYDACAGSYREARGRRYKPDGTITGECWHCGKWCQLRDGLMPRHKELNKTVQNWSMPVLLSKDAEHWLRQHP